MNPIWDWIDSIIGAIGGAISGAFTVAGFAARWVNSKFKKAEEFEEKERIETNTKVNSLNERVTAHDKEIATLMSNDRHMSERLAGFQLVITAVNEKQDKQTGMLNKIIAQNEIILKVRHSTDEE